MVVSRSLTSTNDESAACFFFFCRVDAARVAAGAVLTSSGASTADDLVFRDFFNRAARVAVGLTSRSGAAASISSPPSCSAADTSASSGALLEATLWPWRFLLVLALVFGAAFFRPRLDAVVKMVSSSSAAVSSKDICEAWSLSIVRLDCVDSRDALDPRVDAFLPFFGLAAANCSHRAKNSQSGFRRWCSWYGSSFGSQPSNAI